MSTAKPHGMPETGGAPKSTRSFLQSKKARGPWPKGGKVGGDEGEQFLHRPRRDVPSIEEILPQAAQPFVGEGLGRALFGQPQVFAG